MKPGEIFDSLFGDGDHPPAAVRNLRRLGALLPHLEADFDAHTGGCARCGSIVRAEARLLAGEPPAHPYLRVGRKVYWLVPHHTPDGERWTRALELSATTIDRVLDGTVAEELELVDEAGSCPLDARPAPEAATSLSLAARDEGEGETATRVEAEFRGPTGRVELSTDPELGWVILRRHP